MTENPVVTFDLFSALVDSRTGGAVAFGRLAEASGWSQSGTEIYDTWDALNKTAQRDCREWVPYVDLAASALARCYDQLGIVGHPAHDFSVVLESIPDWPLWPDVAVALPQLATRYRIGVLSNVDNAVFAPGQRRSSRPNTSSRRNDWACTSPIRLSMTELSSRVLPSCMLPAQHAMCAAPSSRGSR
jgi:hypothetical protein